MTLLAPGTPMFFMGEEVGAAQDYRYGDFLWHREDLHGLRAGSGAELFRFYRDIIRLRRELGALRSGNIDVVHVHNDNRVIAFRRWMANEQVLVLASLNNRPFDRGYVVWNGRIPAGEWREIFNSDSTMYGGNGLHNPNPIQAGGDGFNAVIPANGFAVFERV
jgi:1,4-alpha-glucan branching enzyme